MAKFKDIAAAALLGMHRNQEVRDGTSVIDTSAAWQNILAQPKFADPIGLSATWERGWRSPPETLSLMHNAVRALAPSTVIETGTLAAHSTMAFATALQEIGRPARIFTHDYDGDPVSGDIPMEEWRGLAEIRHGNLKLIQEHCPLVEIEFIDGDSRKTLPETVLKSGEWDFWFQDSMHYKEGIYQEWNILKDRMKPGAAIAFDNVDHRHPFARDFIRNVMTSDWSYQTYISGRNRQLWCRTPHVVS